MRSKPEFTELDGHISAAMGIITTTETTAVTKTTVASTKTLYIASFTLTASAETYCDNALQVRGLQPILLLRRPGNSSPHDHHHYALQDLTPVLWTWDSALMGFGVSSAWASWVACSPAADFITTKRPASRPLQWQK